MHGPADSDALGMGWLRGAVSHPGDDFDADPDNLSKIFALPLEEKTDRLLDMSWASAHCLAPELLEAIRRQFGVSHGMLNDLAAGR